MRSSPRRDKQASLRLGYGGQFQENLSALLHALDELRLRSEIYRQDEEGGAEPRERSAEAGSRERSTEKDCSDERDRATPQMEHVPSTQLAPNKPGRTRNFPVLISMAKGPALPSSYGFGVAWDGCSTIWCR